MILDPLGYVPTEIALRTTLARNAFAAQPRTPRRRRRHRRLVEWTVPTFADAPRSPRTQPSGGVRHRHRRTVDGTA